MQIKALLAVFAFVASAQAYSPGTPCHIQVGCTACTRYVTCLNECHNYCYKVSNGNSAIMASCKKRC
ncbi:hypothetical protein HK097_009580 [Rhizophlyctis rosea]|uniref:Uncharacterized protein n=1 Tax=Rhizophlyctis rosea TaxID=64517 RepID=A0AAD5X103_9FUNG|nr:hypothetical protein HK097_009580 [Rhizophlyctis rosea]